MVLRLLVILVALTGCKQSLFDSHGGDDDDSDGGGDGSIASSCPAPCLGDGGGAFDGIAMGSDMHWRYLEDHKDHTWSRDDRERRHVRRRGHGQPDHELREARLAGVPAAARRAVVLDGG